MDKLYLSWNDITKFTKKIHEQTKDLGNNFGIIGLSRGGLVPAVLFSHLKNYKDLFVTGIKSYEDQRKDTQIFYQIAAKYNFKNKDLVYLIDDICDTGGTMKAVENYMLPVKIISISIVYRQNKNYKPNYYGIELSDDRWVVFPWEETK
jgi:xanthine phosphoribosyltransferase